MGGGGGDAEGCVGWMLAGIWGVDCFAMGRLSMTTSELHVQTKPWILKH